MNAVLINCYRCFRRNLWLSFCIDFMKVHMVLKSTEVIQFEMVLECIFVDGHSDGPAK